VPVPLRLSLFYAAFFLAGGVQLPFWPVWLASRGLDAAQIGALLALGQWAKIAANPFTGAFADRSGDPRRVMLLLSAVCLAGYLLCVPARGFFALAVLNGLTAAALASILPIGDSMALAATRHGKADYGRVRVWGTLAFIAATLVGGRILAGRGADVILYLVIALTALNLGSCLLLPRAATHLNAARGPAWRSMLTRRHLLFLATATLINASHSVYYAFGTLHWQAQGFSDSTIAWLWAEGAGAEAIFFFLGAGLVARWGPAKLLALGGAAGVVRWTALALTADLRLLVIVQLLHAGTLAAAHLGAMHYLSRSIPAEHAATGQAVFSAVVGGAGYGVVLLASGWLYGSFGGAAYFAMAGIASVAVLSALLLGRVTAVTNS